jgi:hypothetical protein
MHTEPPTMIIVPANDLVDTLRSALATYRIEERYMEEVVRQCLDIYLDWKGDDEAIFALPYFNRIVVPAMQGVDYQDVYDSVQHHVQTFARDIFTRLHRLGVFPKSQTPLNIDYAFERFVGRDIALFHFNY